MIFWTRHAVIWWWHPAGNAWLCTTLWEHYEFTRSRSHLARIYPLLKGACEFWEARLITTTMGDQYSFTHELIRQTLMAQQSLPRRQRLCADRCALASAMGYQGAGRLSRRQQASLAQA